MPAYERAFAEHEAEIAELRRNLKAEADAEKARLIAAAEEGRLVDPT